MPDQDQATETFTFNDAIGSFGDITYHLAHPAGSAEADQATLPKHYAKQSTKPGALSHEIKLLQKIESSDQPAIASLLFHNEIQLIYAHDDRGSLAEAIAKRHFVGKDESSLRLLQKIASALEYIHTQNIIHCNVNPSNIRLTHDEQPVLINFEIAVEVKRGTFNNYTYMGNRSNLPRELVNHNNIPHHERLDVHAFLILMLRLCFPIFYNDETLGSLQTIYLHEILPDELKKICEKVFTPLYHYISRLREWRRNRTLKDVITARELEDVLKTKGRQLIEPQDSSHLSTFETAGVSIQQLLNSGHQSLIFLTESNTVAKIATHGGFSESIILEITLLKQMKEHPNIVTLLSEHTEKLALPFFTLPRYETDLMDLLVNEPQQITPEFIYNVLLALLSALIFIHNKNIIHRDIKLENIFKDNDDTIKLGDFGLAVQLENETPIDMIVAGTELTMPPEYRSAKKIGARAPTSYEVDIYSLAISILCLAFPRTIVETQLEPCETIQLSKGIFNHQLCKLFNPALKTRMLAKRRRYTTLTDCEVKDSTQRPTARELHSLAETMGPTIFNPPIASKSGAATRYSFTKY